MKFNYNDGGRSKAGFKGNTGDCVTRAISIATGKPYIEVYNDLNKLAAPFNAKKYKVRGKSSARTGVHKKVYHNYLLSLGLKWTPTMLIGQGCKVHLIDGELPNGRLIVCVSRHLTAVIDGEINDTYNPDRNGSEMGYKNGELYRKMTGRCVYGYYHY